MSVIIVAGGLVTVAALAAEFSKGEHRAIVTPEPDTNGVITLPDWVYPAPIIVTGGNTYKPRISDGWGSPRDGGARSHKGADIMYRRLIAVTDKAQYRAEHGSQWHFVPEMTPVLCCKRGKIWSVTHSDLGTRIVVDHGKPFATVYQHCEHARPWQKGDEVQAGEILAYIGYSKKDAAAIRHIHFEFNFEGEMVDPAQWLAQMKMVGM